MYVPLTLKYRPKNWADLIGQEVTVQIIINMLKSERLIPSIIFGGSRGTGKCVSGDTLVWTDRGLIQIKEMFKSWGQHEYKCGLVSARYGKVESSHFYSASQCHTVRMTMQSGRVLEGTPHHRLWDWRQGEWDWFKLDTYKVGDYIPLYLGGVDLFEDVSYDNRDLEFIGFLVGDASLTQRNCIQICVGNTTELEWVCKYLDDKLFKYKVYKDKRRDDTHNIHVRDERFIRWVRDEWGLGYESAVNKKIPISITRLSKAAIAAFLRGLWRADGYCGGCEEELGLASEEAIRVVQELLRHLGIYAKYHKKWNKKYKKYYHYVAVRFWESHKRFQSLIGWKVPNTGSTAKVASGQKRAMSDRDIVPVITEFLSHIRYQQKWPRKFKNVHWIKRLIDGKERLTKSRLKAILSEFREEGYDSSRLECFTLENLVWDEVISMEESVSDVYDFTVPGTHSFQANGYEHHNTTSARILARTLNCEKIDKAVYEPCGECKSCIEIDNETSFAVQEMDAASHGLVDDVRRIREEVRYATASKYKIYIIDECHSQSSQAWQAFLKLLEEPPPGVVFAFCTTEVHKIPETIISRSMHFAFARMTYRHIKKRLAYIATLESIKVEEGVFNEIAKHVNGGMRDAISLLDQLVSFTNNTTITVRNVEQVVGTVNVELLFDIYRSLINSDVKGLYGYLQAAYTEVSDVSVLVHDLLLFYRDILMVKVGVGIKDGQMTYIASLRLAGDNVTVEYLLEAQNQLHFINDQIRRSTLPARSVMDVYITKLFYGGIRTSRVPIPKAQSTQQPILDSTQIAAELGGEVLRM